MVTIIEYSKETNCAITNPIEESNLVANNSIIIPTDKSLSDYIHWEFSDYLSENIDTTDHNYMKENLSNLLITVIQKNIIHLLESCKSNDQTIEKEPRQNVENH